MACSREDEGLRVLLGGSNAEKLFSYFLGHAGGSLRRELTNALSVGQLFEDGVLRALDLHLSGEVGMLQRSLSRNPPGRILLEHLPQEVEGLPVDVGVHLLGEVELARAVLHEDFVVFFALEDGAAEEQVVEDDASREDIANRVALGRHVLDVDDLGRDEAGRAASHEEVLLLFGVGGEAEVADGQVLGVYLPEHDVLGLEVAVDDPSLREVAQTLKNIADDLLRLLCFDFLSALEHLVQLHAFQILEDHVDRVFSFVYALQPHNVGVVEPPHELYLVLEAFPALITGILLLFGEGLDGHHFVVAQALGQVDGREGSLADFLLGLEELVKISLVDLLFEFEAPGLGNGGM